MQGFVEQSCIDGLRDGDLALDQAESLDGILHWMDALMDAAQQDGFPVVFHMASK